MIAVRTRRLPFRDAVAGDARQRRLRALSPPALNIGASISVALDRTPGIDIPHATLLFVSQPNS